MSLSKLLLSLTPSKLFKKDVIAFLIIRRHDLGVPTESLRYISIRPHASLATLRHKIWHLLDLPDYCDEKIILKNDRNQELPLTDLRKGNSPQDPFYLEVWLPDKRLQCSPRHNMLTMGPDDDMSTVDRMASETTCDFNTRRADIKSELNSATTVSIEPLALHPRPLNTMTQSDFKKSDMSTRVSSTTLLLKLQGKRSKDNVSNMLLKIQTDLTTLSQKLSSLENRISV